MSETALLICCVCGQEIADDEEAMYPVASDFTRVAHRDECAARFWDPPGEAFLTEGSW